MSKAEPKTIDKKVQDELNKKHELKKTETTESSYADQAKTLVAIQGKAKDHLSHVDQPKSGLTETQKKEYVEEKKKEAAKK